MGGSGAEGGIVSEGVAQVLDDWAILFSSRTRSAVGESVLFVACQFISARFAALPNTGITPAPHGRTPHPPWGLVPYQALTPPAKEALCGQAGGLLEDSHGGMGFVSRHSPSLASLASVSSYARVVSPGAYFRTAVLIVPRVNAGGDTMPTVKAQISCES